MGFVLVVFFVLLLWCSSCMSLVLSQQKGSNETDHLALLAFKARITSDPFHVVRSWNDSIPYCKWPGIICSGRRHPRRIRALRLQSSGLVGSMAPEIGNLSFLQEISLYNNSFQGEIPHKLSSLSSLRYLLLFNNSFEGEIPSNISRCSNLIVLSLGFNNLVGKTPVELSSLPKLQVLSFHKNMLTGQIPASFVNLSSLQIISAGFNGLSGNIPDTLGQMTRLTFLGFAVNKLSGTIPSNVYNLSLLESFDVGTNQLQGSLPSNIGFSLPNLRNLLIGHNQFHGSIPISISNMSNLEALYLDYNNITGPVDIDFGSLSKLSLVSIFYNHLGSGRSDDLTFVNTITNCSRLRRLEFGDNQFGGILPKSIANLSIQLEKLYLSHNHISGDIPVEIGNLVSLQFLGLSRNLLQGSIPTSIGRLRALNGLYLFANRFIGPIPDSIGNLTALVELELDDNHLEGKIPYGIGNCKYLLHFSFSGNSFNGAIPTEIFDIFPLIELGFSRNSFIGALPLEVGRLTNLELLDVSGNNLSGEIPSTLGDCISLEHLYMKGNLLEGSIPFSLRSLKGLQDLDLSYNNISGSIPKYLGAFKFLQNLNLSFNDLEGEVLVNGVFANLSAFSIIGNNKLCGGIPELHLPTCQYKKSKGHDQAHVFKLIAIIGGCGGSLCLIFMIVFFFVYRRGKETKKSTPFYVEGHHFNVSYAQLLKATDGFSSSNLIGVGSFGSVYKGVLNDGKTVVAVKVFNIQQSGASKSFMVECESLSQVKHRNLVKILTCCSSIDYEGNDFKALIYEFMPSGNLESWLHPHANGIQDELRHLNLVKRLNIAIDIAVALDYLHHHCHIQIIHCDIKPSNILLDGDLVAHLGDFGISRILSKATSRSHNYTSSIGIKGSVGYIPPEYGAGVDVSMHGDVYSYGILLLEMFTGKQPTHEMFKDNFNLHSWAEMALPDGVIAIVDQSLLSTEDEKQAATAIVNITGNQGHVKDIVQKCLNFVIRIGLTCSAESPWDRMEIKDVLKELLLIKDTYLGVHTH